jgi:hypothetical protein
MTGAGAGVCGVRRAALIRSARPQERFLRVRELLLRYLHEESPSPQARRPWPCRSRSDRAPRRRPGCPRGRSPLALRPVRRRGHRRSPAARGTIGCERARANSRYSSARVSSISVRQIRAIIDQFTGELSPGDPLWQGLAQQQRAPMRSGSVGAGPKSGQSSNVGQVLASPARIVCCGAHLSKPATTAPTRRRMRAGALSVIGPVMPPPGYGRADRFPARAPAAGCCAASANRARTRKSRDQRCCWRRRSG